MRASVKFFLYVLQGYLVLIVLAVGDRVLTLAGVFSHPM